MYSVNGIPLDNPTYGWLFRAPSKPISEVLKRSRALAVPGRSGVLSVPTDFEAPVLQLVVQSPRRHLNTLHALFTVRFPLLSMTADSSRAVEFEFLSSSPTGYGDADQIVDVTFMVRLNGAFWRDTNGPAPVPVPLGASVNVDLYPGMSAPVEDAVVRVLGPFTSVSITDEGSLRGITINRATPAGQAVHYDMAQQYAFVNNGVSWTTGTDVSGSIEFFGQPLVITPFFPAPFDPGNRVGRLRVQAAGHNANSRVSVLGRGAYLV